MKTVYSTTKPGWADTKFIAYQKWLQQRRQSNSTSTDRTTPYSSTVPRAGDTQLVVLQKILQREQSL